MSCQDIQLQPPEQSVAYKLESPLNTGSLKFMFTLILIACQDGVLHRIVWFVYIVFWSSFIIFTATLQFIIYDIQTLLKIGETVKQDAIVNVLHPELVSLFTCNH